MRGSHLPSGTDTGDDGPDSSAAANEGRSSTTFDRIWIAFVLVAPVRALLLAATGIETTAMSRWVLLGSLLGAVLVGEGLLQRFGPAVIEPLWQGILGAIVVLAVAVVVGSWFSVSPSDPILAAAFVLLSGAITASRFRRRR